MNDFPGPASAAASPARPVWRLQRAAAQLIVALILIQAFLAGRFLASVGGITVHGIIGNATFAVAAVLAVVAVVRRADVVAVLTPIALALLLTAQIGLGYAGRTSMGARAWHIPSGVLSFGIAVYLASRREAGSPSR